MIWRAVQPEDHPQVLELSRTPMGGRIQTRWGFNQVACPEGCSDLRVGVVESGDRIIAMAMRWRWPDGSPYLSGLRVEPTLEAKPPRRVWTHAYQDLLNGDEVAWTTVGAENQPARKLLEKGCSWLPRYQPRATLTTVFAPLPASQRRRREEESTDRREIYVPENRCLEVASGRGLAYWLGRWAYRMGAPGIPPPGMPIQLALVEAEGEEPLKHFSSLVKQACGLDALAMVVEGRVSRIPPLWTRWESILYQVQWKDADDVPLPAWKGAWL